MQLHGAETETFITALRQQLPENTQIWKAISVNTEAQSAVDFTDDLNVDRYILTAKQRTNKAARVKPLIGH